MREPQRSLAGEEHDVVMRGLIFDLDGTLVDTVYAHVFAWQRAFEVHGLPGLRATRLRGRRTRRSKAADPQR